MTRSARSLVLLLAAALSLSAVQPTAAQEGGGYERLRQSLVDAGYENVRAGREGDCLVVSYESRQYRYDVEGFRRVAERVAAERPDLGCVALLPQRLGIPLMRAEMSVSGDSAHRVVDFGSIETQTLPGLPSRAQRPANRQWFKTDLIIHPLFAAEYGNFDDPIRARVSIAPALWMSLGRGLSVLAQIDVPIQDEIDTERGIVPGVIALNLTAQPYPRTLLSTTIGHFANERYGLDFEAKHYLLDARLALGGRLGYTGFIRYRDGEWIYGDVNRATWSLDAQAVLWPKLALWADVGYARYLYKDHGWYASVKRAFGEVEIGFFGFYTEREPNVGFTFALPLPPGRYARPGLFRVRPAEHFNFNYRYRSLLQTGRRYGTGYSLDSYWGELQPSMLEGRLRR